VNAETPWIVSGGGGVACGPDLKALQRRPWESEGISRRTWYRRRETVPPNPVAPVSELINEDVLGAVPPVTITFVDGPASPPVPALPDCPDPAPSTVLIVPASPQAPASDGASVGADHDPSTPAPGEMQRPSPWGNDVVGWEKWFALHPEEIGKWQQ